MGLVVGSMRSGNELTPEGVLTAVLGSVIDLGTHEDKTFERTVRQVAIGFELPEVTYDFDENGVVTKRRRRMTTRCNISLNSKSRLQGYLTGFFGRELTHQEKLDFDLKSLLGQPCRIQVEHATNDAGNTYANIVGMLPPSEGDESFTLAGEPAFFSFDDSPLVIPEGTPDFILSIIMQSAEWVQSEAAMKSL